MQSRRPILLQEAGTDRLLLVPTDGKPNGPDRYVGRDNIEDTRMALHEARRAGVRSFCVTADDRARDCLPYLFGSNGWMLVRNAGELPAKLPLFNARLTAWYRIETVGLQPSGPSALWLIPTGDYHTSVKQRGSDQSPPVRP